MNLKSFHTGARPAGRGQDSPILLVPYMWIGDFVRCHTVVKLLKERFPSRPVDVLTTTMVGPLLDYMPGVRKGIVVDLPRRRLAAGQHLALASRLRDEDYGQALVMPRTWKSALAVYLAGIPMRTGFVGEARFGLINDLRWGERQIPRMLEQCATLALPKGAALPARWPLPELVVLPTEIAAWRSRSGLPRGQRVDGARQSTATRAISTMLTWPYASVLRTGSSPSASGSSHQTAQMPSAPPAWFAPAWSMRTWSRLVRSTLRRHTSSTSARSPIEAAVSTALATAMGTIASGDRRIAATGG